ncbi:YybH family protein [Parvularcula lutaonensis]|uniref:YybH family protein n=1 Tax=Parvularcula lutaonensis TaxID=491923 RepID=A0ABV7MDA7_9PROT|nr:DUF4440 domain-containing protein [Parvularcula lutaonensis]GGY39430.1 hypothetical protein GCM10007148_04680 [Parvularcula lutaonensis]
MRLILTAAIVLLSFAHAEEPEEAIRSVLSAQAEAWNRGDIPAFMDGYLKTDALRFASGNSVQRGYDETLGRYLRNYGTPEKMGTLSFKDLDVDVLSDDAAVVFGRFHLERPEEGDATGLFTLIFRKIDGSWVIVHDHTSS